MRILLTGGAGFVGAHVSRNLLGAGHQISIYDDLSTGRVENVPVGVPFVRGDLLSPDLSHLLRETRPEAVVHLAAQISVAHSVRDPLRDATVNVLGTVNLMEAAVRAGVRRVVFISSAAVYGAPDHLPLSEEAPTRPLSPYGLSKLTGEGYVRLLAESAGLSCAVLRPANVYGPGQTPEGEAGVVAIFCDRVRRGVPPTIHGDGEQTRDFIYVGDMAAAVRKAVEEPARSGTYNIGTGRPVTVLTLWQMVQQAAWEVFRSGGAAGLDPLFGPERPGDIRSSYLDPSRAVRELGWRPEVGLLDGLRQTLADPEPQARTEVG